MPDLKNKLNDFVDRFREEKSDFQKCVIAHDYLDFIQRDNQLRAVLQKVIGDIPNQAGLFLEREIALSEADFFGVSLNLVDHSWIHYAVLANIFHAMREFKASGNSKRISVEDEIVKGFFSPYSREQIELSMLAFNKKMFYALDRNFFVHGKTKEVGISFNEKMSVLNFCGEKIAIAKQDKITVAHSIFKYIFVNNAENLSDDFFYSEIASDKFEDEEYNWKKYYIACKDIQEKIRKNTKNNIDDFLLFNTGRKGKVSLNNKYLITV